MNKHKCKIIEMLKSTAVVIWGMLILLSFVVTLVFSLLKFPYRACFWLGTSIFYVASAISLIALSKRYQRKRRIEQLTDRRFEILGKKGAVQSDPNIIENGKKPETNAITDLVFRERVFPTQNGIAIFLVITGLIFCLVPYQNWKGAEGVLDFINIFRQTMQMFVVDGGISDFIQDGCVPPDMLEGMNQGFILILNIYTALMCVIAGLIFTFKLIDIFAKEFKAYVDYWFIHPLSDIYVMSELNEASLALAESIFLKYYREKSKSKKTPQNENDTEDEKNSENKNQTKAEKKSKKVKKKAEAEKKLVKNVRIYFCDVYSDNKERGAELISRAKLLGAVVMKRDIAEIKIKSSCRSNYFFLIGSNEEENVEQAQQIRASSEVCKLKKNLELYIYATRQESEFIIDNMQNEFIIDNM